MKKTTPQELYASDKLANECFQIFVSKKMDKKMKDRAYKTLGKLIKTLK